jgi:hypothetical protein
MNYKTNLKVNLMRGRAIKFTGQGFISTGSLPRMRLENNNRSAGTISHRVAVGALEPLMQKLNITKPTPKKRKASAKKGKGVKKNYKSLKFNF